MAKVPAATDLGYWVWSCFVPGIPCYYFSGGLLLQIFIKRRAMGCYSRPIQYHSHPVDVLVIVEVLGRGATQLR